MTTANPSAPLRTLTPQTLKALGRLELMAQQAMAGYVQGRHRSTRQGYALDFAQHRAYVPGDDVKRIDWRAYAKADRYYIKQYEVQTSLRVLLAVDASGSMLYQGPQDDLSKWRYAQLLATACAYVALEQQDNVGLALMGQPTPTWLNPRGLHEQFLAIARHLEAHTPQGKTQLAAGLHEVAEYCPRRSMVMVITDGFERLDVLGRALAHLRARRHEVLLLQVLSPDELELPFTRVLQMRSLEDPGQRLRIDPTVIRGQYLQRLRGHLQALEQLAGRYHCRYRRFATNVSLENGLGEFLAPRRR
jgi:uncharacterized protein (DUF58 family)